MFLNQLLNFEIGGIGGILAIEVVMCFLIGACLPVNCAYWLYRKVTLALRCEARDRDASLRDYDFHVRGIALSEWQYASLPIE